MATQPAVLVAPLRKRSFQWTIKLSGLRQNFSATLSMHWDGARSHDAAGAIIGIFLSRCSSPGSV